MANSVILYIATSLDGYFADVDGSVDWLFHDQDYGYTEFYDSIDIVIMGKTTYEQVLSFGEFPWKEKQCFVFSHEQNKDEEYATIVSGDAAEFLESFEDNDSRLWLVGGAHLLAQFLQNDLIDEYIISIHPVILGSGIPLFPATSPKVELELEGSTSFDSGLLQVLYKKVR